MLPGAIGASPEDLRMLPEAVGAPPEEFRMLPGAIGTPPEGLRTLPGAIMQPIPLAELNKKHFREPQSFPLCCSILLGFTAMLMG